jgi:hypothetical protein
MASAARWPVNPDANFWHADGPRAERGFVFESKQTRNLINKHISEIHQAAVSSLLPF